LGLGLGFKFRFRVEGKGLKDQRFGNQGARFFRVCKL